MTPRTDLADETTQEIRARMLDAAETCRLSQATLQASLTGIQTSMNSLMGHAQSIDANLAVLGRVSGWVSGMTWRGGLVALAFLALPYLAVVILLMVLAGQADALVTLVPGK
jgi:hypothetical protein